MQTNMGKKRTGFAAGPGDQIKNGIRSVTVEEVKMDKEVTKDNFSGETASGEETAVMAGADGSAAAVSGGGAAKAAKKPNPNKTSWKKDMKKNWVMYCIFIPCAVYFIIFNYLPMFGILMAFQDVSITSPKLLGGEWIGFDNFVRLFTTTSGGNFLTAMRNTFIMAGLSLTIGYLAPLILALLVSEVSNKFFKRTVQTVTYMPYFISSVILCSLVTDLVGSEGAITAILNLFVGEDGEEWGNLLAIADPPVFWLIYLFTDIWQNAGYSSIVFVAAIANVDKDLYEAASMDGANRFRRAWSITLPSILPIVVMMFTIKIGTILTNGFDKVVLLYNAAIWDTADTIYSFTYRLTTGVGGSSADYGLSAASGLFQSLISVILLFTSNWLSRLATKTSLF